MGDFDEFRNTYQIKRKSEGSYINGDWVAGIETSFSILADVQPVKLSELELVPEGRHIDDILIVYTDTELKSIYTPDGEEQEQNPDLFVYDGGEEYEVLKVYKWKTNIIPHYKILIARQEVSQKT